MTFASAQAAKAAPSTSSASSASAAPGACDASTAPGTPPHAGQTHGPARFAVIGNPVTHSRSPWIHAHFGQQTGIALQYDRLPAPLDGFTPTVQTFFAQGGQGLNVTVPFKEQAFALAQQNLSPRARLAQAVNTLWMQDGELHGCNTDGVGLVQDILRQGGTLRGSRILLVGAGGAARGVLQPLLDSGCTHLRVVNRTPEKARQLAQLGQAALAGMATGAKVPHLDAGSLDDAGGATWDIIINASSSSLQGLAPALPAGLYASDAMAYDMMYGAQPTPFLQQAKRHGASHLVDGLGMLVGQAAESFAIWHGVRPDPEPVLAALRMTLEQA